MMIRKLLTAVILFAGISASFAAGPKAPAGPLVSNRSWPRPDNLLVWTNDIMRIDGLENASETAQSKAFFTWLRLFCRMAVGGMIQAHEGGYAKEKYVLDANKNLFVYGWGFCDTCSRIADAAWSEFKGDARAAERVVVQHKEGGFHTMYRLRLDGAYGAFDPRYGYYLIAEDSPDARVLDWPEIGDDANILRNKDFLNRSKPFFEIGRIEWARALEVRPTYFANQSEWEKAGSPHESVFGDSHYSLGTRFHEMSFRLPRGTTITRYWDNSARKFYHPAGERANRELPFLPSGRFYRVTDSSHRQSWPQTDPNYVRAKPYLATVPTGEGYDAELEGGKTIGQAWGTLEYDPEFSDLSLADVMLPGASLVQAETAPFLRPQDPNRGGIAILDFYCPYVLVDGEIDATVGGKDGDSAIEIRTLTAKTTSASETDQWSRWQSLPVSSGHLNAELGRPRFNGKDVSIHGVYRFQIRVNVKGNPDGRIAGLSALRLKLYFETGIMSLPPLFPGTNELRFELQDASSLQGPITVTYRYESETEERTHQQLILPSEFTADVASYSVNTPGLIRCRSVSIKY